MGQATKAEVRQALRAAKIPIADNLTNACAALEAYIVDDSFDPFTVRDNGRNRLKGKSGPTITTATTTKYISLFV